MSAFSGDNVARTALDALVAKRSTLQAGFEPMVVANNEYYTKTLEEITKNLPSRRQTPLVNAGYAARVRAISAAIHGCVTLMRDEIGEQPVQIIIIGSGLDIIGLWAHSLASDCVRVIEIDQKVICRRKREMLVAGHYVSFSSTGDDGRHMGKIRDSPAETKFNYCLLEGDLQDMGFLEALPELGVLDSTLPSLFVSEVVLSYLPPNKTNAFLKCCLTTFMGNQYSTFVLLEPIGLQSRRKSHPPLSVLESYQLDYTERFAKKIEKGIAEAAGRRSDSELRFHTFGESCVEVQARFLRAGFSDVRVENLSQALGSMAGMLPFRTPELFDEHASFFLYMQSYCLALARLGNGLVDMLSKVLPTQPDDNVRSIIPSALGISSEFVFGSFERRDVESVRNLFSITYADLSEQFPSVKKMMQSALRTDLGELSLLSLNMENSNCPYSKARGGCFVVATTCDDEGRRVLAGCLGCKTRKDDNMVEICRLLVDSRFRRREVGRSLVAIAEHFARSRGLDSVVATTITELHGACTFYECLGYEIGSDQPIGDLVLRNFVKNMERNDESAI